MASPQRALSERHEFFLHNGRAALRAYDRSVSASITARSTETARPFGRRGAVAFNKASAHQRKTVVGIEKAVQGCNKVY